MSAILEDISFGQLLFSYGKTLNDIMPMWD
jgi:hypothetical protein